MKKLEACHANRCDPVQSNLDKTARLQSDHASPSSVYTLVVQRSEGTRFHCNGRADRIMATSAGEAATSDSPRNTKTHAHDTHALQRNGIMTYRHCCTYTDTKVSTKECLLWQH